ncbi:excinuclease ABC subunit UvrC [Frankia sp. CNm7]|uniref:UvrABC system protein C n=1 Tax=Frankia nepalensis TaxID=1836974 RepID=A0A937RNJ6_9ACTN|nr:excinuclease ABC subunit UvrC [Frankia nepalensis]MBL7499960.1 excinuclease ABC subunit UvrC [Frankia nepalensis]MBL7512757.1 excinuclease ABC subunit UvrC [Frankia nepalensis]MBL7517829.1 excinuclease ABC subunit UvrC [Frankia nepalensis]MBL7632140.1 excinuclease ABC subunit UvrC [Frankia nepalensis]
MADPASYRPAPGSIPETPGVYRFRDPHGRVIYVGKAKNLRARLANYFTDVYALHPRTRTMVTTASSVEWTVVSTEVEALALEYTWIKEYDPRFNVRYRDDKSYPSLAVTLSEEFPRLQVMRGPKRKGVRYFGPYAHAWAIRETLDLLLRVFPARTCSAGVFKRAGQVGRPCLLGYIDRCSAPCVGRVTAEEHRDIVEDFCDFMAGQTGRFLRRLEREMREAADVQDYERAARLRDDAGALRRAMEKQAVVLPDGTDADVVAFAEDELEAAVQVFYVRDGRVRGQRGWVVDKLTDVTTADLVEQFLTQEYLGDKDTGDKGAGSGEGRADIPREVLVPEPPTDADAVGELLGRYRGGRVDVRVPRRGDKRTLLETVERNAKQALALHRVKRASDLTARSRALAELQEALGLADAPLRIECFDVSHTQGSDVVASMVVFEDGVPRKSEYRRFMIRGLARQDGAAQDDTASMYETVSRRFARYLAERARTGELPGSEDEARAEGGPGARAGAPGDHATVPPGADGETADAETLVVDGRPRRFAYPPNLVVVDGGPPQVAAAARALVDLGIESGPGGVALCGLAKRLEEVWLPDEPDPVILPRTSEALYLLQRVRDEAHRFAITYHRQKRSTSMTASLLDGVPGLGETRRKALLRAFGSVARLRAASAEEIAAVPGIGPRTAAAVVAALASSTPGTAAAPAPAVDPLTGEILEPPGPAGDAGSAPAGDHAVTRGAAP